MSSICSLDYRTLWWWRNSFNERKESWSLPDVTPGNANIRLLLEIYGYLDITLLLYVYLYCLYLYWL